MAEDPWSEDGIDTDSFDDVFVVPPRMTREDEFEAARRWDIVEQFLAGNLSRYEAESELGVKGSRFRDLCRDFKRSANHLGMVRGKRGPKPGTSRTPPHYLPILQASYKAAFRSKRASVAAVKREADLRAKAAGLPPLTTHQVRTFVLAIPKRDRDKRQLGKDEFKQKHEVRVGSRIVSRLNEVWQMDHTQVDLLVVDEFDRNRIIGRPWVTMIICVLTRVIVGFYLSMRYPNLNTVAAALVFAVLDKDQRLVDHGKKPGIYPACGLPEIIHTDNAAEFVSDYLKIKLKRYGVKWEHRPKHKKFYGGAIERVIGTFMTRHVHFLPGATGSNVGEREAFESEYNAKFDFKQLVNWFFHRVIVYHGTIHRALGHSPRTAWNREALKLTAVPRRIIGIQNETAFRMTFLPSDTQNHPVTRLGVYFAGRQYMSKELLPYVSSGEDYEIKYNPLGSLSEIWVIVSDELYIRAECVICRDGLSENWEAYTERRDYLRHNPVLKGQTPGSLDWSDEHAFDSHEESRRIEEEVEEQHKAYKKSQSPKSKKARQENIDSRSEEELPAVTNALTPAIPKIRTNDYDF
ncbi:DDE-type integrase/transposase/recombinase [Pseudomonas tremae]|uniref:DDE-type integrase/transposase/recombinase n=1 Tax=Pseudomonas tremae TaxID=200454 RepID=UPI000405E7E8|nr:DDE-type integrase/transposase/recombinase [Pseudomonas tremae]